MLTGLQSVMAAYVAVWAVFFVYQFTISGRLRHLQDEIEQLKAAKR
jgi:CcmD family protein